MEQLWAPALFRLLGFELVLLWLVALPVLLISRQGAVAWRLTAGAFSILGAAITFALREQVAWELGTIVANALLLSGVGFAYACLARLHQLPRSIPWEVWIPAAGFLAFVALWLVDSTPGWWSSRCRWPVPRSRGFSVFTRVVLGDSRSAPGT
jgi:hypothetical protein